MSTKKYYGIESLRKKIGPMTVGMCIRAFREADDHSQTNFAKKLKISRANLCDIEKGRKNVSLERAVKIAKVLGVHEVTLVRLALDDMLRSAKLKYKIDLQKVS